MDPVGRRKNLETIPEGVDPRRSQFSRRDIPDQLSVQNGSSADDDSKRLDSDAGKAETLITRGGQETSEKWSSIDEGSSESLASAGVATLSEDKSEHGDEPLGCPQLISQSSQSSENQFSQKSQERIRRRHASSMESLGTSRGTTDSERRRQLERRKRDLAPERSLSSVMMGTWVRPVVPPEIQRRRLWRFRIMCGSIVENPHVQSAIIFLILSNAIVLGIGTCDFVTDNRRTDDIFRRVDTTFLLVFTMELFLQMIYRGMALFSDSWLVFDFVFVALSWSVEWLQVARSVRIFRAFRLVTRIDSLRTLVLAIGNVMPRLWAIGSLMLLVFYIFGVLFTQLFRDLELSDNYFGSLPRSLFTCMEFTTLEWAGVTREVMTQKTWAWAPVIAFICITGFIFFNLFIAVICDALKVVEMQEQAERKELEQVMKQIESGFFETSTDERIAVLSARLSVMQERERAIADAVAELAGEWGLHRREMQRRQHLVQRQHREKIHLHRISSERIEVLDDDGVVDK